MKAAIAAAALLLAVLHHDVWFFHDSRLVFGFVPIGLFWHSLYSVLAALLWWVAIRHAWPTELIRIADDDPVTADPVTADPGATSAATAPDAKPAGGEVTSS